MWRSRWCSSTGSIYLDKALACSVPSTLEGLVLCYARGMTIKAGDKITPKRGKWAGQEMTVVNVSDDGIDVVTKDANGGLHVYVPERLKQADEPTVTLLALAEAISDVTQTADQMYVDDLVDAIKRLLPGFDIPRVHTTEA